MGKFQNPRDRFLNRGERFRLGVQLASVEVKFDPIAERQAGPKLGRKRRPVGLKFRINYRLTRLGVTGNDSLDRIQRVPPCLERLDLPNSGQMSRVIMSASAHAVGRRKETPLHVKPDRPAG